MVSSIQASSLLHLQIPFVGIKVVLTKALYSEDFPLRVITREEIHDDHKMTHDLKSLEKKHFQR